MCYNNIYNKGVLFKMNIVVCEDDEEYRAFVCDTLNKYIENRHSNTGIVLSTANSEDVREYVKNNSEVTLYYLDIKLAGDVTGLDIAESIREKDYKSHIIFITNYFEMMPLTYEYKLEALDYITKGAPEKVSAKICQGLEFVENRQKTGYDKCLNIYNKQKNFSIPFNEICFIESVKSTHKLNLYYDNGMITFYALMKDICKQLDGRFVRCHKSLIVNTDKIVSVDKHQRMLELEQGYVCGYSPKYRELIEK